MALLSLKNQLWRYHSSTVISGIGKATLKDLMILHTKEEAIKSTYNSHQNIPTNLPRWNSILKFGILTSHLKQVRFVSIYWRTNGLLLLLSELHCFPYKLWCVFPSQMILKTLSLLASTKKIGNVSMNTHSNGLRSLLLLK